MKEIKMVFIWLAGIAIFFYWMILFFTGNYLGMVFEAAVSFLVAERCIDLHNYIVRRLDS